MRTLGHPCPPRRAQLLACRAKLLRARATESEPLLWEAIRHRRFGLEVRRQVPIGRFVADFLVPEARFVVEVDGAWHAGRAQADACRDRALRRAGYRVLRLEAQLVERDVQAAVERIRAEVEAASAAS